MAREYDRQDEIIWVASAADLLNVWRRESGLPSINTWRGGALRDGIDELWAKLSVEMEKLRTRNAHLHAELEAHEKVDRLAAERDERLTREKAEVVRWLGLVLPLAKGYAHEHPVGSNQEYVDAAEACYLYAKMDAAEAGKGER